MAFTKPLKGWIINIMLLLASLAIALVALEIILRLTPGKYLIQGGLPRYYFTKDDKAGHDIAENLGPVAHSIYGGYKYKIWSNKLGCFDEPYMGETEYILLAGDSFIWGYTAYEKKVGKYIENNLGFRVLKCGVSAYGTEDEYYKIKKIVTKTGIAPKLIIIGYFLGNDMEDDFVKHTVIGGYLIRKREIDVYTGKETVYSDESLREKIINFERFGAVFKDSDSLLKKLITLLAKKTVIGRYLSSLNFTRLIAKKTDMIKDDEFVPFVSSVKYPWLERAWQRHFDNLKKIKELAAGYNSKLLMVLIPSREQVYDCLRMGERYDWEQPNNLIKAFFVKEDIDYLDLTPVFRLYADERPRKYLDDKKDFYWRYEGHWNEKGNRLAGALISRYILDKDIIGVTGKDQKMAKILEDIRRINND